MTEIKRKKNDALLSGAIVQCIVSNEDVFTVFTAVGKNTKGLMGTLGEALGVDKVDVAVWVETDSLATELTQSIYGIASTFGYECIMSLTRRRQEYIFLFINDDDYKSLLARK